MAVHIQRSIELMEKFETLPDITPLMDALEASA
jgi:hypothetical protein